MQINPTFNFVNGATQSDITQFESAVNIVVSYFDTVFTNSNLTLNVNFAYGEQYSSDNGSTISYKQIPNAGPGTFTLGGSQTPYDDAVQYSTLRSRLLTLNDTLQGAAYATLPAVSPFTNSQLRISTAEEKALGFQPSSGIAGYDGVIGIVSNEELQAGGFSADWTKAAPSSANQFYLIGTIEHELSEVMGRVSYDGSDFFSNSFSPTYTLMDLFRYSAPGVRQTTNGNPSYFSTDGGQHVYYYWNNPTLAAGDLGDWAPSGPMDLMRLATTRF